MTIPTLRESGFTLLEVIVAFSILAIGILGINAMILRSSEGERYAAQGRTANRLAVKKLEELRSMGDSAAVVTDKNGDLEMDAPTGDKDERFGSFVIQYAVENTSQANAYLARVTVGWGGVCQACIPEQPDTWQSAQDCKYKTSVSSVIFTRNTD